HHTLVIYVLYCRKYSVDLYNTRIFFLGHSGSLFYKPPFFPNFVSDLILFIIIVFSYVYPFSNNFKFLCFHVKIFLTSIFYTPLFMFQVPHRADRWLMWSIFNFCTTL
ncbi:hypothetical protein L9F63_016841, partial [Diploptera punctata]